MAEKTTGHKHVAPLAIGTALVAYGLLQQFYQSWGPLNLVATGVLTFLIAGLWHDNMCKMG
ncbi:MAG: hypothetical protein HYW22_00185 [Candidatus Aenigmarchaeota archaeon]|nr:hypothetical protein [Candidatus Aenigmarchaeota archaeon]